MKISIYMTCLFALLLTACNGSFQSTEVSPSPIMVEVTRIVQITTTPISTVTMTLSPTLDQNDTLATEIAERIGTPIVASDECYKIAQSERELNNCAGVRLGEIQNHMAELFKVLETYYQERFPERLEKFQNYHSEWEDFSSKECMTRSGFDGEGAPSILAPMNYCECMIVKYEDRLREYQVQIFEWNQ